MFVRPKLKDICNIVSAIPGGFHYLKLTESGGFEVFGHYVEGSVEIIGGGNLRKSVRKALDLAESKLHERKREFSRELREED
jgi:hypothetical protein